MGAYLRFFERRVERELREQATRGVLAPTEGFYATAKEKGEGDAVAGDRRTQIPKFGLREYWYPALPARRVPKKKPLYWRMLGEELAFFRNKQGEVVAVSDVCPHRGASMSKGSCFYQGTISCPYHGATFDETGECKAFLPEGPDSKMPGALKIKTYPTRTLRGWVFVWMGEGAAEPIEKDVPPELFDPGPTVMFTTYTYWQCNWILAIENQNDSHNGFYAHRNSLRALTMYRMRSRTPMGPRSRLIDDQTLIPLMDNQNYYADASGREPLHLYYPGLDAHWPLGRWRKLLWAIFKPWNWLVYNRFRLRRPYVSTERWAPRLGSNCWNLPCTVRTNGGIYSLTRFSVPVTENLSRIVYFHHRNRMKLKIGQWIVAAWFYAYFNYWYHYDFSGQDGDITQPCRYWTEENLSSTDSHLVMLRKLIAERSRDAKLRRAKQAANAKAPTPDADPSLAEAAARTEAVPLQTHLIGTGGMGLR